MKTAKELLEESLPPTRCVWTHRCEEEGLMYEVGIWNEPDHPLQGEWLKVEDVEHLQKVDRTNADLVIQCNRMDSILHNKDEIIQKLKRDVETLTARRNQLVGDKLEIINAFDKLIKMDSHCRESRHPKEDQHASYDPCPIANRYLEAKKEAQKTIDKFIRKPKG